MKAELDIKNTDLQILSEKHTLLSEKVELLSFEKKYRIKTHEEQVAKNTEALLNLQSKISALSQANSSLIRQLSELKSVGSEKDEMLAMLREVIKIYEEKEDLHKNVSQQNIKLKKLLDEKQNLLDSLERSQRVLPKDKRRSVRDVTTVIDDYKPEEIKRRNYAIEGRDEQTTAISRRPEAKKKSTSHDLKKKKKNWNNISSQSMKQWD